MSFKDYNQKQNFLLPPNFEVFLGESHQAIVLNEFIDELDTKALLNSYNNKNGGASAYNPIMLLKVLLYAYSNATFSSRGIAKKLKEDIAFMFLAGNNNPDFRTLCKFRKEKSEYIADIFTKIVNKAKEMEFISFGNCSIDGTKIYANASKEKNYNQDKLKNEIQELLQNAKDIDAIEDALYGDNEDDIDPELKTIEGRKKRKKQIAEKKNKLEKALHKIPNSKKSKTVPKRNTTDPDSRLMKMKRKDFANGYNVQNITENGIIITNYIDDSTSDQNTLIPAIKEFKKKHNSTPKILLADKGYSTTNNYNFCEKNKINTYIPPYNKTIDLSKYTYDKKKDTYTNSQGHVFYFKEHRNIRQEVSQKQVHDKNLKPKEKHHLYHTVIYQQIDKKTKIKGKCIHINHDWINHCKKQNKKLSTPQGQKIYKIRGYDVEGVFGNIKKNLKFTHFNLRGLQGVKIEWNLISIVNNIQKIHKFMNI